jgi:hypothetical protein
MSQRHIRRSKAIVVAVMTAFACLVCACATVTTKDEYAAYRAAEIAEADATRLTAERDYLAKYPGGRWAGEFQEDMAQSETKFFESQRYTEAGMKLYLDLYPKGTFASQVRSRLAAMGTLERRQREQQETMTAVAEAKSAREAELRRTWMTRFLGHWLHLLTHLQGWGAPIASVATQNAAFSKAFGRAPRPRCTHDECLKYYTGAYAIPIPGGTRVERTSQFIVLLRLDQGKLVRAELLMPGWGFSRWSELENRTMVVDVAPEERDAAVAWATDKLRAMLPELQGATPEAGYALAPIAKPVIGPPGTLIDTQVESPEHAAPVLGNASAPDAAGSTDYMAPVRGDKKKDLVLAPVLVTESGAVFEDNSLETESQATSERAVVTELPETGAGASAPQVWAYRMGSVRVALFAASGVEGEAPYDGVVIEPVALPEVP